jgi:hypothetical protein
MAWIFQKQGALEIKNRDGRPYLMAAMRDR